MEKKLGRYAKCNFKKIRECYVIKAGFYPLKGSYVDIVKM